MPAASPEGLKEWEDARGRRRVTWKGRKGFPVMLRKDETGQQAYERTIAAELTKATDKALHGVTGAAGDPVAGADPGTSAPAGAGKDDRARPPGSDPKPRGGRPMGRPRPSEEDLVKVWAELLVMPAIPMGLPVRDPERDQMIPVGDGQMRLQPGYRPRCEYCRDHFIQTGPLAAAELVKLSRDSDPLRRVLEQVSDAWGLLMVGGTLFSYLAKPAMHHLAPAQALEAIGPVLGVPPRPAAPPRSHAHRPEFADAPPAGAAGA